jgi:hypothetical protein
MQPAKQALCFAGFDIQIALGTQNLNRRSEMNITETLPPAKLESKSQFSRMRRASFLTALRAFY